MKHLLKFYLRREALLMQSHNVLHDMRHILLIREQQLNVQHGVQRRFHAYALTVDLYLDTS